MSASFVATIWQCVPVGMSFPMLELWRSWNVFALQGRRSPWEVPMVLCSTEFKDWSDVVTRSTARQNSYVPWGWLSACSLWDSS